MSIFDKEPWEDRRDGERAAREGLNRGSNPYRDDDPFSYRADDHRRAWDRGYEVERDRREEEHAEEERHERHLEERRRQEREEYEAAEWDAHQRAAQDADAAAAYDAECATAEAGARQRDEGPDE